MHKVSLGLATVTLILAASSAGAGAASPSISRTAEPAALRASQAQLRRARLVRVRDTKQQEKSVSEITSAQHTVWLSSLLLACAGATLGVALVWARTAPQGQPFDKHASALRAVSVT